MCTQHSSSKTLRFLLLPGWSAAWFYLFIFHLQSLSCVFAKNTTECVFTCVLVVTAKEIRWKKKKVIEDCVDFCRFCRCVDCVDLSQQKNQKCQKQFNVLFLGRRGCSVIASCRQSLGSVRNETEERKLRHCEEEQDAVSSGMVICLVSSAAA